MINRCLNYGLLLLIISTSEACTNAIRTQDKRVIYINSYHKGYPASDSIAAGLQQVLEKTGILLTTCYLDTKNDPDSLKIAAKVQAILKMIKQNKPDLLIVSDDAAVRYVIKPYFKNKSVPVVFCGVNWSASSYGLPVKNITGMLEVLPLRENLETIRSYYPKAKKLTVLSEMSVSENRNTEILDTLYTNMGFKVQYRFVKDFSEWRAAFITANQTSDIIYLPTNGAVQGWNKVVSIEFVKRTIRVPVITCDDFMMPYCVYGLTKVAKEQGEWAANTAIKILNGVSPELIPVVKNKESRSYYNADLAARVGFKPGKKLLEISQIVK